MKRSISIKIGNLDCFGIYAFVFFCEKYISYILFTHVAREKCNNQLLIDTLFSTQLKYRNQKQVR